MPSQIIRAAALVLVAAGSTSCTSSRAEPESERAPTAAAPAAPSTTPAMSPQSDAPADAPVIAVYKSPTCGCCGNWVEHVKAAGFAVEVHDVDNLSDIKADAGVPATTRSCHTAIVGGYALEGHVPASTIQRLLREKPAIAGLAVPGMPVGSPGMEVPGQPADKYDVVAFKADGATEVYESH
jgi:hypothetical protein